MSNSQVPPQEKPSVSEYGPFILDIERRIIRSTKDGETVYICSIRAPIGFWCEKLFNDCICGAGNTPLEYIIPLLVRYAVELPSLTKDGQISFKKPWGSNGPSDYHTLPLFALKERFNEMVLDSRCTFVPGITYDHKTCVMTFHHSDNLKTTKVVPVDTFNDYLGTLRETATIMNVAWIDHPCKECRERVNLCPCGDTCQARIKMLENCKDKKRLATHLCAGSSCPADVDNIDGDLCRFNFDVGELRYAYYAC